MRSVRSPIATGAALLAVSLALGGPAGAVGECRRFGTPSFTADRTVTIGGHTIRSKVTVEGATEREDIEIDGHRQVRLASPGRLVTFDPDARTGLAQAMKKPAPPPKDAMRIDVADEGGDKVVTIAVRDKAGQWRQLARTTCRSDGVPLAQDFTAPVAGAPVQGTMTHSNIAVGPVDAALLQVPADVRLKK